MRGIYPPHLQGQTAFKSYHGVKYSEVAAFAARKNRAAFFGRLFSCPSRVKSRCPLRNGLGCIQKRQIFRAWRFAPIAGASPLHPHSWLLISAPISNCIVPYHVGAVCPHTPEDISKRVRRGCSGQSAPDHRFDRKTLLRSACGLLEGCQKGPLYPWQRRKAVIQ